MVIALDVMLNDNGQRWLNKLQQSWLVSKLNISWLVSCLASWHGYSWCIHWVIPWVPRAQAGMVSTEAALHECTVGATLQVVPCIVPWIMPHRNSGCRPNGRTRPPRGSWQNGRHASNTVGEGAGLAASDFVHDSSLSYSSALSSLRCVCYGLQHKSLYARHIGMHDNEHIDTTKTTKSLKQSASPRTNCEQNASLQRVAAYLSSWRCQNFG